MPSSLGTDAGITALEASYRRLAPMLSPSRLSPRHKERLDDEAILHLTTMEIWSRAKVVLLHATEENGVDMKRVAQKAFDANKRVGLAVSGSDGLDFVEIYGADGFESATVPEANANAAEGDTTGFACDELIESLCLVPGLVFDGEGRRIASDASVWDRFLAFYPGNKVALAHALQISNNPLPVGDGNVRMDFVVSDGCVWRCRR